MEILGTPPDDFMAKISSESVSECIRVAYTLHRIILKLLYICLGSELH